MQSIVGRSVQSIVAMQQAAVVRYAHRVRAGQCPAASSRRAHTSGLWQEGEGDAMAPGDKSATRVSVTVRSQYGEGQG